MNSLNKRSSPPTTRHRGVSAPLLHAHFTSRLSQQSQTQPMTEVLAMPEMQDKVLNKLQVVPNFPRPGLNFTDITPVLEDPEAFKVVIDAFVGRYKDKDISAVAGIESRGFIFAAPIALGLGIPFVPLRKPGKLASRSVGIDFRIGSGVYSKGRLEIREGALKSGDNVLIIDDMIGTGATLVGACDLVRKVGASVVECAAAVELEGLGGREMAENSAPCFVLLPNPLACDGSG